MVVTVASILVEGETPISKVMFDAKKIFTQILHRRFLSYKESLMVILFQGLQSWESAIPKTYQQDLPSVAQRHLHLQQWFQAVQV